jgi:hypothetical protein
MSQLTQLSIHPEPKPGPEVPNDKPRTDIDTYSAAASYKV